MLAAPVMAFVTCIVVSAPMIAFFIDEWSSGKGLLLMFAWGLDRGKSTHRKRIV